MQRGGGRLERGTKARLSGDGTIGHDRIDGRRCSNKGHLKLKVLLISLMLIQSLFLIPEIPLSLW